MPVYEVSITVSNVYSVSAESSEEAENKAVEQFSNDVGEYGNEFVYDVEINEYANEYEYNEYEVIW